MLDLPFWVAIPVIALFIPITAIILDGMQKMKEREHAHRERLKAMEMGLSEAVVARLDPEIPKSTKPRGRGAAYYGAVWTGIGAGLLVATLVAKSRSTGDDMENFAGFIQLWSFPALGIGIALLLYGILSRNGHGPSTTAS